MNELDVQRKALELSRERIRDGRCWSCGHFVGHERGCSVLDIQHQERAVVEVRPGLFDVWRWTWADRIREVTG